eukprot:TRINITY_DN5757_c0_g3_i2.p1 TRINITY_DN5757_c0_g3~~TRINITY_DN5757_c0_g3_i2.p1  ORF type:complete len:568 (+),score=125.94 TRINITY_DN5757_c0_g3_i2:2052-3755(+)
MEQQPPGDDELISAIVKLKIEDNNFGIKTITTRLKTEHPTWLIGPGRVRMVLHDKKKLIDQQVNSTKSGSKVNKTEEVVSSEPSPVVMEEPEESISKSLLDSDFIKTVNNTTKDCEEYLKWVKSEYNLKASSNAVPSDIVSSSILKDAVLHDVRVFVKKQFPKKKDPKHRPTTEDEVYEKSSKIRDEVSRGNTLLSFRLPNTKETLYFFPLKGLPKFTGGMGDDDDTDLYSKDSWKKFFIKDPAQSRTLVITNKENGSAGHITAFRVDSQYFIVGGSKNVHLLVRNRKDLSKYHERSNVDVALKVLHAFFDQFEGLSPEKQQKLLSYLDENRVTACFEMLDPEEQHIEPLDHLKRPILKFITFCKSLLCYPETERQKLKKSNNSLCENPCVALKKAHELGLTPIEYDTIEVSPASIEKVQTSIRSSKGTEGKVLYFLDVDGNVIGILKKKSVWYIAIRCIREKMKMYISSGDKGLVDTSKVLPAKIKNRILEIKRWLSLSEETVNAWTSLGTGLNAWIYIKLKEKALSKEDIQNKFPIVWRNYLKDTNNTDDIPVILTETSTEDGEK